MGEEEKVDLETFGAKQSGAVGWASEFIIQRERER
jgi:hypothetical protein